LSISLDRTRQNQSVPVSCYDAGGFWVWLTDF